MAPALEERLGTQPWPCQCTEFGHALAISRDRDELTAGCAVDNFAALVSQVSNAYFIHNRKRITRETPPGVKFNLVGQPPQCCFRIPTSIPLPHMRVSICAARRAAAGSTHRSPSSVVEARRSSLVDSAAPGRGQVSFNAL
jgi:hypothetical protein